jgi:hypothetical protein
MAGITLEQAEAKLAQYLAAEEAVLTGQSYRIQTAGGERELRRANLAEIQAGIELWDCRAKALGATATGGSRLRTIVAAN